MNNHGSFDVFNLLLKAILKSNAAVKYQMLGGGVLIVHAEIAKAQELIAVANLCVLEALLQLAAAENLEAVGIQAVHKVLACCIGLCISEEVGVEANLSVGAVVCINPMDGSALDLAAVGGISAVGLGVVGAENLGDVAIGVLHTAGAGDEVSALQTALGAAGVQTLILGNGNLQEIIGLNVNLTGEAYKALAGLGIVGVVLNLYHLGLALGVVGDGELDGTENAHYTLSVLIQILAQAMLQETELNGAADLGYTDSLAEVADGLGGVAAASQAGESGHAGIIPAGYIAALNKGAQLALGHNGVVDAKACKLDLAGSAGYIGVVDYPVVERTVILVLQRAQRMGNALKCILNGMSKVIHGEDAPLGTLTVMLDVADTVDDGVAHIEVAAGKVNLCAQSLGTLGELAVSHALEQIQRLLDGSVTPGRGGGDADIAAVSLELLGSQLADIGKALLDEANSKLISLFEIVAAVEHSVAPIEAQPVNILLDSIDELGILLSGVGVVKAQVAKAAVLFCGAKINAKSLAVADVQIAVGLGREAGVNSHTLILAACGQILVNKGVYKILGDFFHFYQLR